MELERKPFEERVRSLKSDRQSWEAEWKDISTYICPTRGFFDEQPARGRSIDHKKVLDSTATRAARILAAGMTSGLTSPSRPWFRLGLRDADLMDFEPVKLWLNDVQQRMMAVFSQSNIYGILHSIYYEIGPFGTGAAIILSDFHSVIRGRSFTTGEYYLGTGADGRVNTFYRVGYYTVGQLVEEFGIDHVTDTVKSRYREGKYSDWVKYHHLIMPNQKRDPSKADSRNMPFSSIYWEDGSPDNTFLRVSGYEQFPVLAPRWDLTTTADCYGKGPGTEALGDTRMLQTMQKNKLIALEKVVNPPIQKDSSVAGEPNTLPGGVSVSSASVPHAGVRAAYEVRPDLSAIELSIEKTSQKIMQTFYADLFLMVSTMERSGVTAREIVERHEEKLLMLGPVLDRLQGEMLDPLIDRAFYVMLSSGLIPPPPQELEGQELKPEYISMLAQAQKMVGTTSIQQLVGFAGTAAEIFPEAKDKINIDEAIDEMAEMYGVSPKIIRSPEEVQKIREARDKAALAQQQAVIAAGAIDGAKKLSETPVGTGSALDNLLGTDKK
jgi:hypothetical protein